MNILVFNQPWLVPELKQLGHTVTTVGHEDRFDFKLFKPVTTLKEILELLPSSKQPDVIFLLDNSTPLTVTGFSDYDIPIVFISVDTFHHLDLHSALSHICDLTYVAQKTFANLLQQDNPRAHWLPLWLSNTSVATEETRNGRAAFIGTLDQDLNPRRVKFFEALKKQIDIDIFSGSWVEHFPKYDIIINQSVKDDLNFRVFEALGSKTMLVTERTDNGIQELFTEGKHYLSYEPDNVNEAAEILQRLQNDLRTTRTIAAAGWQEVRSKHLPEHRITTILSALEKNSKVECKQKYLIEAKNLNHLSYMWERRDDFISMRLTLEYALLAIERGLQQNEIIIENLAAQILLVTSRYDHRFSENKGKELLSHTESKYPGFIEYATQGVRKIFETSKKAYEEKQALHASLGIKPGDE